jgi:alpha-L-fucosidase
MARTIRAQPGAKSGMRLIAEDGQALLVAAKGPSPMMSTRQYLTAAAWTTVLVIAVSLSAAAESKEGSKTVSAKPTPQQAAWQDMEVGMFIHFAPNTWQDKEGDEMSTPLGKIDPAKLDTDQWASVAQAMGAGYIVFVAKHVGGFCMWQTDTTDYGIKDTAWRGGKGDVLKDLSESCRKKGVKLGVYLSPQDLRHKAGVGGRCGNKEDQDKYSKLYRQQLIEVLSRYGQMCEVWFDGSNVVEVGDIIEKHAPKAMVFQGPHATIRWVGNEDGFAPYPAWNAVSLADAKSGVATVVHGKADGEAWLPNECDARIRATWFWNTRNAPTLKSLSQLMEIYYRSVGHGAVLLLNHTPDPTGLIPEADAKRAAEFGAEVKRRFGTPIAETAGKGDAVELALAKGAAIDHVIAMEDILQGERVRQYVIEGFADGQWVKLAEGSAIGHKKIDRFDPRQVSKVRLRCLKSAAEPQIRRLAAYQAGLPTTAVAGK